MTDCKRNAMNRLIIFLAIACCGATACEHPPKAAVVFQSDFGLKDGAVSAMKGVAVEVDPTLKLYDLTHEIPVFNTWEAAYRLQQTAPYWPAGTVFVSVVDPGVGTERKSVVLKTKTGHYFVTPDNGTLTLIAESLGIDEVRQIDEELNRRKDSQRSYTFHGRDVYAYTGARLAAGVISFEQAGALLPAEVVKIPYRRAVWQGNTVEGSIPILDIQFGNVWTNIKDSVFNQLQAKIGEEVEVSVAYLDSVVYRQKIPYAQTFGALPKGQPLVYINSLLNVALAINQGSFADSFHIGSGPDWNITIKKQE